MATFTFTTEVLSLNKSSREGSADKEQIKNIRLIKKDCLIQITKSVLIKIYRAKFITKVHFMLTTFAFTAIKAS